ncbi:MAG: class I SAM-dependent methyltransferase [Gammaproteobacteria bacterium]|nr:class I SAM-dependent methyltransferase [Gammaproteobacteria bacterium]
MLHRPANILCLLAGSLMAFATAHAGPIAPSDNTHTLLQEAVNGSWRSAANKARDQYRHPVETLEFFGIRPDMTVIELDPGGGWYTEILAPFLYDHGHLIEASAPMDSSSKFMRRMADAYAQKLKGDSAVYGHVEKIIPFAPPKQVNLGPDDSADMVLTFRNAHDWLNHSPETLEAVFQSAYKVLKPGGVFSVTEHRARPFADAVQSSKELHRIPEDYMIEAGLKAGFRLAGVSEINANPKDPEDINVHHLPPNLMGAKTPAEKAKMEAIGESDRMTLKFVKP